VSLSGTKILIYFNEEGHRMKTIVFFSILIAPLLGSCTDDTPTSDAGNLDYGTSDMLSDTSSSENDASATKCDQMCQRGIDCGIAVTFEVCRASCAAYAEVVRICTEGCLASTDCADYLSCISTCAPGPTGDDPYGSDERACGSADSAGQACTAEVIACNVTVDPSTQEKHSACMPFCDNSDKCPAPKNGTALPFCDTLRNPGTCLLDCRDGKTCPNGMVCLVESYDAQTTILDVCLWPVK
jgi:hypothetical protein